MFHAVAEYPHDLVAARQVAGWTLSNEIELQTLNAVHSNTFATVQVQSTKRISEPQLIEGPRQMRTKSDANDANSIAKRLMAEARKRDTHGNRGRGPGEGDPGPPHVPE